MADTQLFDLIEIESKRQQETINLIASENYASEEVLKATGSILTNKYSEGYAGKRYYAGNKVIDEIELLAIDRAKTLFGAAHVNVQPYSGSPANLAVHLALVEPGETTLGLDLSHGGHLTHGAPVSYTGKLYKSFGYTVAAENETIDFDVLEHLAVTHKPKLIWCGGTAYPRIWDWQKFAQIADKVGAFLVADIAHIAGLTVTKEHPSPIPYVHLVTTTTHKSLRGPRGALIMVTEKGLEKDAELPKKIDRAVFPGLQGGPHNNVTAGIAVCLKEAVQPEFATYTKQVVLNSKAFATGLIENGLTLVSGGTDNHLVLVNLGPAGLTGREAQERLEEEGIVVNRNTVPFETRSPFVTSGIRMGSYAMTTRGWKENDFTNLATRIASILKK